MSVARKVGEGGMSEWVKVPDYQGMIGTECIGCGKTINLGYVQSALVPRLCEECKEAIKYAKKLMKEQETHKFFVDESGKITPLPVVVRCKDCIFGNDFDIDIHPYVGYQCEKGYGSHTGDWFCGDGKRK